MPKGILGFIYGKEKGGLDGDCCSCSPVLPGRTRILLHRRPTPSYETTDPTVNSQVVALQASGADLLLTVAIPKLAARSVSGLRPLAEFSLEVAPLLPFAPTMLRDVSPADQAGHIGAR